MNGDSLGDRMKRYEGVSNGRLMECTPIIIRIDGRHFHTVTRGFNRPYDKVMSRAMQEATLKLCNEMTYCVFGYTQSDEISLVLYNSDTRSDSMFDAKIEKLCSISASVATMEFYKAFLDGMGQWLKEVDGEVDKLEQVQKRYEAYLSVINNGINFDARCFNIPKDEVVNYIIWRQNDAVRNSIQGLGHKYFSQNEMQGKNNDEILGMLIEQYGVDWNSELTVNKRGTAVRRVPTEFVVPAGPDKGKVVHRNAFTIDTEMPVITQDKEYVESCLREQEDGQH